jgi:gliding motility-associated-like protein
VLCFGFNSNAQLAMPDYVCIGDLKHYNVNPNPILGSTYNWSIDGIPQSGFTANYIDITWNITGTYILEVQELSADGCFGPIRSGEVIVKPLPVAVAASNSPVCVGSPIDLTSTLLPGITYLWEGPNGYLSMLPHTLINSAKLTDAGIYALTVTSNGCASLPSYISVVVNNCIVDFFIPEGFSPNADGINELFVIRGIENYPNNTILIYNRWGNKLFEASPYQNNWDGRSSFGLTVNRDILPIGTYFYLLNLGNGTEVIKGTIYLNK